MREPAAATPELKELSVEMLQLYYTFTRNDLVYLKLSELESVARLAVVSSYNEWMDAVTVCADAFTIDEVGNTAAFLLSDYASGITGDNVYVDAGFHAVAVPDLLE